MGYASGPSEQVIQVQIWKCCNDALSYYFRLENILKNHVTYLNKVPFSLKLGGVLLQAHLTQGILI